MLASRGSFIGIVDMIIKADRWQQLKEQGVWDPDDVMPQCGTVHHCFYGATCNAVSSRPSSVATVSRPPSVSWRPLSNSLWIATQRSLVFNLSWNNPLGCNFPYFPIVPYIHTLLPTMVFNLSLEFGLTPTGLCRYVHAAIFQNGCCAPVLMLDSPPFWQWWTCDSVSFSVL